MHLYASDECHAWFHLYGTSWRACTSDTYRFENDEVERIVYCTYTVLCNILKYIYIGQIEKKCTSPVFAFNMQITTKNSTYLAVSGGIFGI